MPDTDQQEDIRPYVGERVEYNHADGFGGTAVVHEHVRLENGEPVIRATDVERLRKLTLMPFEYEMPDHSAAMARHLRDTRRHIRTVGRFLRVMIEALDERARVHDDSKLEPPEAPLFAEVNDKLAGVTYGSDEYEALLDELQPALDHHYAENRHHPEHFEDGMTGMHLVDLVEMLADWAAATKRHDDGDLHASIEHNQERFEYSDDLKQIFHNTADWLHSHADDTD